MTPVRPTRKKPPTPPGPRSDLVCPPDRRDRAAIARCRLQSSRPAGPDSVYRHLAGRTDRLQRRRAGPVRSALLRQQRPARRRRRSCARYSLRDRIRLAERCRCADRSRGRDGGLPERHGGHPCLHHRCDPEGRLPRLALHGRGAVQAQPCGPAGRIATAGRPRHAPAPAVGIQIPARRRAHGRGRLPDSRRQCRVRRYGRGHFRVPLSESDPGGIAGLRPGRTRRDNRSRGPRRGHGPP